MSTKQHITTSLSNTTIRWSHQDHFKVACKIAPVWFIANWAYNHSLAYTSITSSTVLASTGSLFTFLFAVMSKDESYTTLKLLGVLLGVTGSILTGLHDVHNTPTTTSSSYNETTITTNGALLCVAGPSGTPHHVDVSQHDAFASHAIWGDALGLLSAVGYGAYAVMIRLYCPHEDSEAETAPSEPMRGFLHQNDAATQQVKSASSKTRAVTEAENKDSSSPSEKPQMKRHKTDPKGWGNTFANWNKNMWQCSTCCIWSDESRNTCPSCKAERAT